MLDPAINLWLQRFSTPWLDGLFIAITSLGYELAYLLVLPILYWCVDRRRGHQLAVVIILSMWFNGLLKELFTMPRPGPHLGVRWISFESSPGFPSGHAQGMTTLWGYLAASYGRRWLWVLGAVVVALVSLSRLYLGVHFLLDVVSGLLLGALIVWGFHWFYHRRGPSRLSRRARYALAVALPLLAYTLEPSGGAERILGFLMGVVTSDLYAFEAFPYRERVAWWQQLLKLAVGYVGFFGLAALNQLFVPVGLPALFGYAVIGAWASLGAPWAFRALGLAGAEARAQGGGARRERRQHEAAVAALQPHLVALVVVALLIGATSLWGAKAREATQAAGVPAFLRAPRVAAAPEAEGQGALALGVLVIGHRGAAGLAPENTLPAFEAGIQAGAGLLELDVHRTSDGVVVLMHDDTVDRTTDGKGRVSELTFEQIRQLDAGYWFTPDGGETYPWRGKGVQVPTLLEVLQAFPQRPFIVEIKEDRPGMVEAVLAVVDQAGARSRVQLASFHDAVIARVRAIAPDIPTNMPMGEAIQLVVRQRLGVASLVPIQARSLQLPEWRGPLRVITPGLTRLARKMGLPLHAWTINDEESMRRLIGLGVEGIITDYPDRAVQVARQFAGAERARPETY